MELRQDEWSTGQLTGREQLKYEETRVYVYNRAEGLCEMCGKPISYLDYQMAHMIPQNKMYLKKYGKEVIHHRLNFVATCGLSCNSRASIANHPLAIEKVAEQIREELSNGTEA